MYVFTHLLTIFVVTLQSLILYKVSTYDYYITATQSSLEVCPTYRRSHSDAAVRALALCRERQERELAAIFLRFMGEVITHIETAKADTAGSYYRSA